MLTGIVGDICNPFVKKAVKCDGIKTVAGCYFLMLVFLDSCHLELVRVCCRQCQRRLSNLRMVLSKPVKFVCVCE